jgi:hypothetical protein
MDRLIFKEWLENVFKPEVEKFYELNGTSVPVLLLLDNAPGHYSKLFFLIKLLSVIIIKKNFFY